MRLAHVPETPSIGITVHFWTYKQENVEYIHEIFDVKTSKKFTGPRILLSEVLLVKQVSEIIKLLLRSSVLA